jgi:hypothetical protein
MAVCPDSVGKCQRAQRWVVSGVRARAGQTLQPNPDNREAMAAAFQRHTELGETLFAR